MENTERQPIRLPKGFNPDNPAHVLKVIEAVEAKRGPGWTLESVDMKAGEAQFVRVTAAAVVNDGPTGDIKQVTLPAGTKESDGKKRAATFRETYPGFEMTYFDPHNRVAILKRLDADVRRVREAVANELRLNEWQVQVSTRRGGGYSIGLGAKFSPAKDQAKLEDIAQSVAGKPGWYVRASSTPQGWVVEMIPADPPTFPATIPTPLPTKVEAFDHTNKAHFKVPLGWSLPNPGQKKYTEFFIDLAAGAHTQIGGISGAGKTVTINCYIAQMLSRGAELVIIDLPSKSTDFEWCKPYVRPGGWGCDGTAEAATAIELVRDEGARRSKLIRKAGVADWKDMPAGQGFRPLVVIIDEVTGLYAHETVPKAGKDAPLKLIEMKEEAEAINFHKDLLIRGVKKTAAELRFTGVFLLIATQIASTNTGLDTALRTNLHHRILLGASPTENNRKLIFADADRVPKVPDSVADDPDASRGVGSADPEGGVPTVFKSYFATVKDYSRWLDSLGIEKPGRPAPTKAQIEDKTGLGEDAEFEMEQAATAARRESMPDPMLAVAPELAEALDGDGKPLHGAARAAMQSKLLASVSKDQDGR